MLASGLLFQPGLGRTYPRLYFIHYIDHWRSGKLWKRKLFCPMSVGWKECDEVPNGPRFRELFSLIWSETFGVSARNRQEALRQKSSTIPELFDARIG